MLLISSPMPKSIPNMQANRRLILMILRSPFSPRLIYPFLSPLRARVNSMPLPESIGGPGLPLPPEADMLIFPNYQLAIQSKSSNQAPQDVETEDAEGSKGDIGNSQPPQEQKSDHEASAQRVSFSISAKRPKLEP
eukprot:TRINITY_DN3054_c0_g1_i1.p1 TRINITY_DN3054_c0_g1~~TRINITY_DN3054_c0_g1_i1.p1  ORF type:complete len:136 (+),score=17.73 TRINITY_DN3054_c0_g1_i1:588-995(+)